MTQHSTDPVGLVAIGHVLQKWTEAKKSARRYTQLLEPSMADGASTASTMGMAPNAAMADVTPDLRVRHASRIVA